MPKSPREEKLFGDTKTSFIKRNHFADDDDVIAGVLAHEAGLTRWPLNAGKDAKSQTFLTAIRV